MTQIDRDEVFRELEARVSADPFVQNHGIRYADALAVRHAVDVIVERVNAALAQMHNALVNVRSQAAGGHAVHMRTCPAAHQVHEENP